MKTTSKLGVNNVEDGVDISVDDVSMPLMVRSGDTINMEVHYTTLITGTQNVTTPHFPNKMELEAHLVDEGELGTGTCRSLHTHIISET